MFTLKFHNQDDDYWEVYHANSYSSEIVKHADGSRVREVFIEVEGKEKLYVSNKKPHFNVCYVVNELGNTIDRIYAPEAA